jgi:hypothetical protein
MATGIRAGQASSVGTPISGRRSMMSQVFSVPVTVNSGGGQDALLKPYHLRR